MAKPTHDYEDGTIPSFVKDGKNGRPPKISEQMAQRFCKAASCFMGIDKCCVLARDTGHPSGRRTAVNLLRVEANKRKVLHGNDLRLGVDL